MNGNYGPMKERKTKEQGSGQMNGRNDRYMN